MVIGRLRARARACAVVPGFDYRATERQVIVGAGGAPLAGSVNYGYVVAQRRDDDGAIVFKALGYATNAVIETFAVTADGAPAPS
jgi:hypothetical protein